jgi:hypothetical protein
MTSCARESHCEDASSPIIVRTRTAHAPAAPVAFDCVTFVAVRAGSAFLFGEFGQWPLKVGDVAALAPATLCGIEPEGLVTTTTIHVDRDYLIDQFYWRYSPMLADRLEARRVFDVRYPSLHNFFASEKIVPAR